jgi:hypothetical protein
LVSTAFLPKRHLRRRHTSSLRYFFTGLLPRGRTSNVTATIFLRGKDEKAPKKICPFVFRIRDAIVQKFNARPLRFKADGVDSSKSRLRIPEALNKIVRANLVNDYHLYKGSFPFSAGVSGTLPGASRGCVRAVKLPAPKKFKKRK